MAPRVQMVQNVPTTGRVMRRPTTPFYLENAPFVLQPFCCFPVLPGETLKNLLLQSRVVTDPIKNGLIGWWQEYYFFYVKHRDLEEALFETMMLDQTTDLSSLYVATAAPYYHRGSALNWQARCLARIVECYFRDQGEAVGTLLEGLPLAKISQSHNNWLDSAINAATLEAQDIAVPAEVAELDESYRTWEFMRANMLTVMTYEEYLQTYGVRPALADVRKPELIRYVKEWQYPSNTVDPTTGIPSSAVSWAVAERGDKDRFFAEPGFIMGISLTRPKVYLANQKGLAISQLNNAFSWLAAVMRDDPYTSVRQVPFATGPLDTVTEDFIVDMRDLFVFGEQFIGHPTEPTSYNQVGLPGDDFTNSSFIIEADLDAIFVGQTLPTQHVRQDGVVTMSILGTQVDQT